MCLALGWPPQPPWAITPGKRLSNVECSVPISAYQQRPWACLVLTPALWKQAASMEPQCTLCCATFESPQLLPPPPSGLDLHVLQHRVTKKTLLGRLKFVLERHLVGPHADATVGKAARGRHQRPGQGHGKPGTPVGHLQPHATSNGYAPQKPVQRPRLAHVSGHVAAGHLLVPVRRPQRVVPVRRCAQVLELLAGVDGLHACPTVAHLGAVVSPLR